MVNKINSTHSIQDRLEVTDIANIELELIALVLLAHVVLLLLIPAKDADFAQVRIKKATQDGISKRTCTARDEQDFVSEHLKIPLVWIQ